MKQKLLTLVMKIVLCLGLFVPLMIVNVNPVWADEATNEETNDAIYEKATITLIFHYNDEEADEVVTTQEVELNQQDEDGNWYYSYQSMYLINGKYYLNGVSNVYEHNGKEYDTCLTTDDYEEEQYAEICAADGSVETVVYDAFGGYRFNTYGDVTMHVYWNRTSFTTTDDTSDTDSNNGNTDLVDSNSVTGKSRFIALLYENVLERYATESEVADWVQELENGKNGAEVAQGFIFSQEFLNKNLSDEDYVECLYMSMMGRSSDEGGKNDWVTRLDNGVSRLYVFKQFIGSAEFTNLCDTYGIDRGDVAVGEARDENYDVTRFVARNYREFLGRDYDEAGLNDWTSRINNREQTMQDIASGFVFSQECTNMNLSNEAYVQMLYRGCFDRTGDEAGVEDWVSKLDAGTYNREQVFLGFANSQEFANMVSSYGL